MNARVSGLPINLNIHSGGMTDVICAKRAGRWGSGRVSTRKATLVGSYGDGGAEGALHDGVGAAGVAGLSIATGATVLSITGCVYAASSEVGNLSICQDLFDTLQLAQLSFTFDG